MRAGGTGSDDFLDAGDLPAAQALEARIHRARRAGTFAARGARALADVAQHPGAGTAPAAARLRELHSLDRADLAAAKTLEPHFLVPIRAHPAPVV